MLPLVAFSTLVAIRSGSPPVHGFYALRFYLAVFALVVFVVLMLRDRIPDGWLTSAPSAVAVADSTAAQPEAVIYDARATRSVLSVDPAEMVDVVRETRRVRPDRRVLLAVADIHEILTGAPRQPVRVRWDAERWLVSYGDQPALVGVLPELATLGASRQLLVEWARRVERDRPLPAIESGDPPLADDVRRALDSLSAPAAILALARIDREWRAKRDPRLLPLAADALALLSVFCDDRVDMSDGLLARALAASVVSATVGGDSAFRTDALVAFALGYTNEAREGTTRLSPSDPVFLFFTHDDSTLRRVAEEKRAEPLARYLAIMRASERGEATWTPALEQLGVWSRPTSVSVRTGLFARDFDLEGSLPAIAGSALTAELRTVNGPRGFRERTVAGVRQLLGDRVPATGSSTVDLVSPAALVSLDEHLARAHAEFRGPFVDSAVIDGYFRAYYYSAVYAAARFNLYSLASVGASSRLAKAMSGSLPAGPAQELSRWIEHSTRAMTGEATIADLTADVTGGRSLGPAALEQTIEAIDKRTAFDEHGDVMAVTRILTNRLDGRPTHIYARAGLNISKLWDMPATERFYRSAAQLKGDDDPNLPLWVARFLGDTATLLRVAGDASLPYTHRLEAVRELARDSARTPRSIDARYRALIAERPEHWPARMAYVTYLRRQHDAPAVERTVTEWLARGATQSTDTFEPITARTELSRALEAQGRYAEAWSAIEPAIPSYQGGAMRRGVAVLGALGRLREARELADALVDRYPDAPYARAEMAALLWRERKFDEAARYLESSASRFDEWTWRDDVAGAFVAVFGKSSSPDAVEAMDRLVATRIPVWVLSNLSIGLRRAAGPELAFEMQSRLDRTAAIGSLRLPILAARYLRESRGESASIDWLRRHISPGVNDGTSMMLYQESAFDELWTLDTPGTGHSPFTWLMRAAAVASSPAVAAKRRSELLRYYEIAGNDPYDVMGRHLMGLVPAEQVLALATTPDRRCETAYYLGVRAKAEGRLDEASDWFQVAVATRRTRNSEYAWALRQLNLWPGQGHALSVR